MDYSDHIREVGREIDRILRDPKFDRSAKGVTERLAAEIRKRTN